MTSEYEKQREQEHKRNAEIEVKLKQVAKILKTTTEKSDSAYDCQVNTPDLYMHFSAGYGDKRIHISGRYPRNADGSYAGSIWYTDKEREVIKIKKGVAFINGEMPQPKITISADKTPEQIAQDITRRFMPDYLDYKARVQKVVDAQNDYQATTQATLEAIKGAKLTEYETKAQSVSVDIKNKVSEYGIAFDVKVSREDVSLEIRNINKELALKIAKLLKEAKL